MDWAGLMRVGLRGLGLAPDVFWALTPAELMIKMGIGANAPAMGRARLAELAAAWPDLPKGGNDDD